MSDTSYEFAVVCEAQADRDSACSLADRVLLEEVNWTDPETLNFHRKWRGVTSELPFLRWASVDAEYKQSRFRNAVFGHFEGRPGEPDALNARKALILLADAVPRPAAVVLVRDSDGDSRRISGLKQARDASNREWPFPIVIGVAEPKREAWVLVGFEPKTQEEAKRLEDERQRLSFDPVQDAHLLTAREHGAKKDAKKALDALTQGDLERELMCLAEAPLATLAARGGKTGLAAYLQEVRYRLVPILSGRTGSG